ncbi:MAG TPA: DoxX family protein [Candidatus Paceibacterota bacterium]|nr:DoxX family protein [Candidatus Paceibacterota bacterium]
MIHHIKKLAATPNKIDAALFLIRIGLGTIFISEGWQKFSAMTGTIAFFHHLGFPAFLAYFVATVELVGGILVLLGIWTQWAAVFLAAVMFVVIVYVKGSKGFFGSEFELSLFLSAVAIALAGAGTYTAKSLFGKK